MFTFYRLARAAGHSVTESLTFALSNKPLPSPTEDEQKQRESDYLAKVADLEKRSREKR